VGEDTTRKLENLLRNLREGRVTVVQAVLVRAWRGIRGFGGRRPARA
jgi:DNA-directed RNA polymerase specialized sigma24 family protein